MFKIEPQLFARRGRGDCDGAGALVTDGTGHARGELRRASARVQQWRLGVVGRDALYGGSQCATSRHERRTPKWRHGLGQTLLVAMQVDGCVFVSGIALAIDWDGGQDAMLKKRELRDRCRDSHTEIYRVANAIEGCEMAFSRSA